MSTPNTYRPDQRRVRTRIQTNAGWMLGSFHIPAKAAFLDFLNRHEGFVRLTDVTLPSSPYPLPFLALQQPAVRLIVPEDNDLLVRPEAFERGYTNRLVACVLESGVLRGEVMVPDSLRVSDYLMDTHDFMLLRGCTMHHNDHPTWPSQVMPAALLNMHHVIGVADVEANRPVAAAFERSRASARDDAADDATDEGEVTVPELPTQE